MLVDFRDFRDFRGVCLCGDLLVVKHHTGRNILCGHLLHAGEVAGPGSHTATVGTITANPVNVHALDV